METEPKSERVTIMMAASELKAVEDWSFGQRIRSRGEAIRRLIQMGLEAEPAPPPRAAGRRSRRKVAAQP